MNTPIICSAADGFIYHFQESATLLLLMKTGLEGFTRYLAELTSMFAKAFEDLYKVLGTRDLDSL